MEKKLPPAPARVKITKCSYEQGWYKTLIGQEFDVDNAGGIKDYVLWEDYAGDALVWRHISKGDCIRIEQPTPQQNVQECDATKMREEPPAWYKKDHMHSWLINMGYSNEIGEELSEKIAEGYQTAYAKGWEMGRNKDREPELPYEYFPKKSEQNGGEQKILSAEEMLKAEIKKQMPDQWTGDEYFNEWKGFEFSKVILAAMEDYANQFKPAPPKTKSNE